MGLRGACPAQVSSPDADMSAFEFGDLYAGEDAPKRMRITLATGPLDLQLADLKALTWEQHVHIWKVSHLTQALWLAWPSCSMSHVVLLRTGRTPHAPPAASQCLDLRELPDHAGTAVQFPVTAALPCPLIWPMRLFRWFSLLQAPEVLQNTCVPYCTPS